MSFSIVHLSDPHFGWEADLRKVQAAADLVPDLAPRVIVLTGDLTQRARHGEFQAARAFVQELERTAPVFVIPGNHDVQWWWRPLVPFGRDAIYSKYRTYFGPNLAPTLQMPEAILASVLTSHGVAWGSLSPELPHLGMRHLAVKGHLPSKEVHRAASVFGEAAPEQLRVLVMHHNVLRGRISQRMGLARWKSAQKAVLELDADLVLCGHDHEERADYLGNRVVISCAGALGARSRGDRPSVFNRITVEDEGIQVEMYAWVADDRLFRRTDVHSFARPRRTDVAPSIAAAS